MTVSVKLTPVFFSIVNFNFNRDRLSAGNVASAVFWESDEEEMQVYDDLYGLAAPLVK